MESCNGPDDILALAKEQQYRRYFKAYQIPALTNLGTAFGMGLIVTSYMAGLSAVTGMSLGKAVLCGNLGAVVGSVISTRMLLFFSKKSCCCHRHTSCSQEPIVMDGSKMHKIDVSFSKQDYSYSGQRFEGAEVHTSFGYACLDLRGADITDGAVITLDCSFGGMEIRVDKDVCVINGIDTAFAGVDCDCNTQHADGAKTLYLKGHCNFGGIEIK